MTDDDEVAFIIGVIVGLVFGFGVGIVFGNTVHGFTMTEQLNRETAILEFCIDYRIESEECNQIYGNIPFP